MNSVLEVEYGFFHGIDNDVIQAKEVSGRAISTPANTLFRVQEIIAMNIVSN
jgi:hypothetical protein